MADDRVLLSGFDLWHFVLNRWYLPRTEKDGETFEAKLARAGLSPLQDPLPHATLRREMEKSWERIFDLSWSDLQNDVVHRAKYRSIQGTMWELLLDDVVESTDLPPGSDFVVSFLMTALSDKTAHRPTNWGKCGAAAFVPILATDYRILRHECVIFWQRP